MLGKEVNVLITGITSELLKEVHQYAKEKRINVLGGTHYSTEKFACQRMCKYFDDMNLESDFVEGIPIIEDM